MSQVFQNQEARAEFQDWRRSVPYLYDYADVRVLPYTALSVDRIADSQPWRACYVLGMGDNNMSGSLEKMGVGLKEQRVSTEILSSLPIKDPIIKVQTMPHHSSMVASLTTCGVIAVVDMDTGNQLTCLQHTTPVSTFEWCPECDGVLASCTKDGQLHIWNDFSKPARSCQTDCIPINDISWNYAQESVVGIAHHDGVGIYDTRQKSFVHTIPFTSPCSILRFNPLAPHVFLTASENVLSLWDLRFTKHFAHQLEGHDGDVTCACWSPQTATALATGGNDRKVLLWDLMKIGNEQTAEEAEDGPAELLFTHQGHTECGMVVSVGDDCTLQVWKMMSGLYKDDELDVSVLECMCFLC